IFQIVGLGPPDHYLINPEVWVV
ncbi:MAG: hypothetical protein RLZZ283_215, partial [Candidatus Parcubacteria bacterium]